MLKYDVSETDFRGFEKTILPKNIKYYDEVLDEEFVIKDLMKADVWDISVDAKKYSLKFSRIPEYLENATKIHLASYLLDSKIPAAIDSFTSLVAFFEHIDFDVSCVDIFELKANFLEWLNSGKAVDHYAPKIRIFLAFLAEDNFGRLKKTYVAQIKNWPVPKVIKNARAINGSYKLNFYEEFKINQYLESEIEHFSKPLTNQNNENTKRLLDATIVALCMSFGLRPKQLAMLKVGSIQKFGSADEYYDIAVPIIKQKHKNKDFFRKALPSKWQLLIIKWWEYKKICSTPEKYTSTPLLSLTNAANTALYFTIVTKDVTARLTLESKTVYHFRHTFAQRMADSGASAAEISVALTQTTTETAQAYVAATANMARVLSQALGQSEVYKNLPDLFSGRLIIRKEMESANPDEKVAGLVDGVLMPGIGLCSIKVSLCERSPLLACHTCPKFLPLMDELPHTLLANQLREIVHRFKSVEMDTNLASSPITKLGETLAIIEKLIDEIKESKGNLINV